MDSTQYFDEKNYQFNTDSKNGVYIIHGFTNTTYEVKELAHYLSKQGFYTKADNLPGHGTSLSDCNGCRYNDWIEFVEQGLAEMISRCNNVYIIGISMGSVLALHLSALFPINAGVFASTVLQFKDEFGVRILTPLLHRLIPIRIKNKSYSKDKRFIVNYYGYHSWPMTAVNEMRKLTNKIRKILPKINCPALIIHSKADLLSPQKNISLIYNSISSKNKEKLIVENAGHNLFLSNPDQKIIFNNITEFLNRNKKI